MPNVVWFMLAGTAVTALAILALQPLNARARSGSSQPLRGMPLDIYLFCYCLQRLTLLPTVFLMMAALLMAPGIPPSTGFPLVLALLLNLPLIVALAHNVTLPAASFIHWSLKLKLAAWKRRSKE